MRRPPAPVPSEILDQFVRQGPLSPSGRVLRCLRVKTRDEATVRRKAICLALAVLLDGTRDILGIWIEQTEGAKFWMKVFSDLKTRGCQDILIAVTDGLKGMSDAPAAVFPATTLQTCIVPLIRNSLDFANWKERKPMPTALPRMDPRHSVLRIPARSPAADLYRCPPGVHPPDQTGMTNLLTRAS